MPCTALFLAHQPANLLNKGITMFFLRYLDREINIHPSFFGNNVHERLRDQLYNDLEGSCNGEYYIICIMDIHDISLGKIRPGTGEASFIIQYRAILWKPFKGETVGQLTMKIVRGYLT